MSLLTSESRQGSFLHMYVIRLVQVVRVTYACISP